MSAASESLLFSYYIKEVSRYAGIPILIFGCIGGLLNIIVFLSLRTFRENSCGFYLIIMSFVNLGQLSTGLVIYILNFGYSTNLFSMSVVSCKFLQYIYQICALTSITCLCLATIDQFLSTSSYEKLRKLNHIKIAYCLTIITIIIWIIHGIPCLLYYNIVRLSTGKVRCMIINIIYGTYSNYFYVTILTGFLPVFLTILFGLLSCYNIKYNSRRIIPIIRHELNKQLTKMVLILDIFNIFALMPYPISFVLTSATNITDNPYVVARISFFNTLTIYFYFLYFACPFYIFVCVSERFRRQLIYVLFKVYCERWRQRRIIGVLTLPGNI